MERGLSSRLFVPRWAAWLLAIWTLGAGLPELAAHDLWLERVKGGVVLRYGHIKSEVPDPLNLVLESARVRDAICQTAAGRTAVRFSLTQGQLVGRGSCDALAVTYEGGFFSKTVNGTVRLPRNQASNVLKSWISFEYVKRIDAWNAATSRPVGQRLEITPQSSIESASVGQKITLLVTSNGAPLSGVVLAVHDEPRGVTDSRGLVNIRIREKGTQLFTATQVVPLKRPDADEEIHTARIQFEVKS